MVGNERGRGGSEVTFLDGGVRPLAAAARRSEVLRALRGSTGSEVRPEREKGTAYSPRGLVTAERELSSQTTVRDGLRRPVFTCTVEEAISDVQRE